MKRDITVILLCFVAAATGANVQPILTGAGKLLFPEASPGAYLQASSGSLTVAAGGTNQNVIVTPSGTGYTRLDGNVGMGAAPDSTAGKNLHLTGAAAAARVIVESSGGSGRKYALIANTSGKLLLYDWTAATERITIDSAGLVGVNQTTPGYQLDVGGQINASTGFRSGGTAGLGVTKTVRASGGAADCTLIFTGGILTGGTC